MSHRLLTLMAKKAATGPLLPTRVNILWEGDSRSALGANGTHNTFGNEYPNQCVKILQGRGITVNWTDLATGGATMATVSGRDAQDAAAYNAAYALNIAMLWDGVNDNSTSDATLLSQQQTWYNARVANGFIACISTEQPAANRATWNGLVRSSGMNYMDLAADACMGAAGQQYTDLFFDNIHPTDEGAGFVAARAAQKILELMGYATGALRIFGFWEIQQNIGSTIIISGQGFIGATNVTFNGVGSSFVVNSDTKITATVPMGATNGYLQVQGPHGADTTNWSTTGWQFTVGNPPTPTITSLSATSGVPGDAPTANGTNLGTAQNNGVVVAGLTSPNNFLASASAVTFFVPMPPASPTYPYVGPVTIQTTNGKATSAPTNFTINTPPAPTATSTSPTHGPVGTAITVNGTNLYTVRAVNFSNGSGGWIAGTGLSGQANASCACNIPTGAVTGQIQIVTDGGTILGPTVSVP